MSSILKSKSAIGFVTGLLVPPVLTKVLLEPVFVQRKYDEIDGLKHLLDYIGWHVRNLEESNGYDSNAMYVPVSYFQS